MTPFKSWESIKSFIDMNSDNLDGPVIELFKSDWTNEPDNMIKLHRYLDQEHDCSLSWIVENNFSKFTNTDLNLYKFKIACGYRGPLIEDNFICDTVKTDPYKEHYMEVAQHKDFPPAGKRYMYEIHKDPFYLSEEVQDIFVF